MGLSQGLQWDNRDSFLFSLMLSKCRSRPKPSQLDSCLDSRARSIGDLVLQSQGCLSTLVWISGDCIDSKDDVVCCINSFSLIGLPLDQTSVERQLCDCRDKITNPSIGHEVCCSYQQHSRPGILQLCQQRCQQS